MIVGPAEGTLRFDAPWAFALIAAVLLAFVLAARRNLTTSGGGLLFPSLSLVPRLGGGWRASLRWTLVVLRLVALCSLVVALARPQTAQALSEVAAEGIDIALVLDISSSMTESGFGGGTKIDSAKRVLKDFVAGLKNDRVGVVVFSANALVLSPLTLDYKAVGPLIDPVQPGRLLQDGTAIGNGVAAGVNLLRDSTARSKVVVLLTDGENNMGNLTPLDGAQLARTLGMRLYAIGAVRGVEARGGNVPVDEQVMKRMSESTGGAYFRATDETALREIYHEIQQLEKTRFADRTFSAYDDAALPFLLAGLALLVLEMLLATAVFRGAP